jgi:hypothetical protein
MDPTVHFDVVKSELTRQVFNVTGDVGDEMVRAVEDVFGGEEVSSDQEWREVKLFDGITKVIARTSNRVFVGLPLCRCSLFISAWIVGLNRLFSLLHWFVLCVSNCLP